MVNKLCRGTAQDCINSSNFLQVHKATKVALKVSWLTFNELYFSHTYMYTLVHNYRDVVIFVVQLSGDNTFEDVCPLLGNTDYTQHVRVATDLQLTTTNLPDVVRRIRKFNGYHNFIIVHLHFSLTSATVTIVLLEMWRLMLLGMMRLLSLVKSFKMMYVNTWTCL